MNREEMINKAREDRAQLLAYLDDETSKEIVLSDVTCVANLFSEKSGERERRILEIDDIYEAIRKCPESLNIVHKLLKPAIAAVLLDDEHVDRFALFFTRHKSSLEFFKAALESLFDDKVKMAMLVSKPTFMDHVLGYIDGIADDEIRAESIVQVLSNVKPTLRNGVFESLRTRDSKRLLNDIGQYIDGPSRCVTCPELISFFIEIRANEVLPHIAKALSHDAQLLLDEINNDTCRAEVLSQHFVDGLTTNFTDVVKRINVDRDKLAYARAVRNVVVAGISNVSDILLSAMKEPQHVPLVLVVLTAYLSAIRADDKDAYTPFESLFKDFLSAPDLDEHFKSELFLTLLRHLYNDGPMGLKPLLLRNEAFVEDAMMHSVDFSDQVDTMLANVLDCHCPIPTVFLKQYRIPLQSIVWNMKNDMEQYAKSIEKIFTVHPELCRYLTRNQLLELINSDSASREFIDKLVECLMGSNRTAAMNNLVIVCFRKVKNPIFFEELFKEERLVLEAASTVFYPNILLAKKNPVLLAFLKENTAKCRILPKKWHNIDLDRVDENQEVPLSRFKGRFKYGDGVASTYLTSSETAIKVF